MTSSDPCGLAPAIGAADLRHPTIEVRHRRERLNVPYYAGRQPASLKIKKRHYSRREARGFGQAA